MKAEVETFWWLIAASSCSWKNATGRLLPHDSSTHRLLPSPPRGPASAAGHCTNRAQDRRESAIEGGKPLSSQRLAEAVRASARKRSLTPPVTSRRQRAVIRAQSPPSSRAWSTMMQRFMTTVSPASRARAASSLVDTAELGPDRGRGGREDVVEHHRQVLAAPEDVDEVDRLGHVLHPTVDLLAEDLVLARVDRHDLVPVLLEIASDAVGVAVGLRRQADDRDALPPSAACESWSRRDW